MDNCIKVVCHELVITHVLPNNQQQERLASSDPRQICQTVAQESEIESGTNGRYERTHCIAPTVTAICRDAKDKNRESCYMAYIMDTNEEAKEQSIWKPSTALMPKCISVSSGRYICREAGRIRIGGLGAWRTSWFQSARVPVS